jgi:hypothetical protein
MFFNAGCSAGADLQPLTNTDSPGSLYERYKGVVCAGFSPVFEKGAVESVLKLSRSIETKASEIYG